MPQIEFACAARLRTHPIDIAPNYVPEKGGVADPRSGFARRIHQPKSAEPKAAPTRQGEASQPVSGNQREEDDGQSEAEQ
jgi:hypothetical protein